MWDTYSATKAYKLLYYLKNRWHLISIKKDIFFVKDPEEDTNEEDVIQAYYWSILRTHGNEQFGTKWYIWARKALELHFDDFSVPDSILLINAHKQAKHMVVATKAAQCKTYTVKGKNMRPHIRKHTETVRIAKHNFRISSKELALLECMFNHDNLFAASTNELVRKVVKRSTHIDATILTDIIRLGKHHTSINRLYKIAKQHNKTFAKILHDIIKRYSFFLDV